MSEFDDLLDHLEGASEEAFEENWENSMSDARLVESFAQCTLKEQEKIKEYIHQWWLDHDKTEFTILIVDERTREMVEHYRFLCEDIPGWSE
jgi:hypothetical protein